MNEKYTVHVPFHGYRNPEQASGKKKKKHSKSSLQWTLGNRGTLSFTFFTTVLCHINKSLSVSYYNNVYECRATDVCKEILV